MTEVEITLARAYLAASGQDPVAALVRSVGDVARLRRSGAAAGASAFYSSTEASAGTQRDGQSENRSAAIPNYLG